MSAARDRRLFFAIFGVLALVACACGSTAAAQRSPKGSPSRCVASSKSVCLGRDASGKTTTVHRGQTITITLADSLQWSGPRVTSPGVIRAVGEPTNRGGTFVAIYIALAKGRTAIDVTGRPICSQGSACPQFILLWRASITVTA
jgi:hypothetical protein